MLVKHLSGHNSLLKVPIQATIEQCLETFYTILEFIYLLNYRKNETIIVEEKRQVRELEIIGNGTFKVSKEPF